MRTIPRTPALDDSLALLLEGYEFISRRCERLDTDVFETRIQLRPAICMRGPAAAELFYDSGRLQRTGAIPRRVRKTLFGDGSVQVLDDGQHRHRKQMLLSLLAPERAPEVVRPFSDRWHRRLPQWEQAGRVVLEDEVGRLLTESVHEWAGIPLEGSRAEAHENQLRGMIHGGARAGPVYLWGRWSRQRAEGRIAAIVDDVRAGRLSPPEGRPLHVVAWHRDLDGALLTPRLAAVELLNILRPTVAVEHYVTFVALALHRAPRWRDELRGGGPEARRRFVNEVRRFFPFFPFSGAKVREEFVWQGYRFPRGRRVFLDLFGTIRDPERWGDPTSFRPERFAPGTDTGDPYDLIPQGGGDHLEGHRCPGEWLTIELMAEAVRILVDELDYRVPPQDLRIRRGRLPALPRSGMVLDEIRVRS